MSRLSDLTCGLRAEGHKPVVPFVTAGFPDEVVCRGVLRALKNVGCRLVEIGVPFSDPVADGPVIQAASQRALEGGMTPARSLDLAAWATGELGLDVVLMGYLNPVLRYGPVTFVRACAKAGVAGVIVPDLPLEEAAGLRRLMMDAGVDLVGLVAPTTDETRLRRHAATAAGFQYLISTTGVTGSGAAANDHLEDHAARVRRACPLPLYIGFGVGTAEQAARVGACADGAIVGSALLRQFADIADPEAAGSRAAIFFHALSQALNAVSSPGKGALS